MVWLRRLPRPLPYKPLEPIELSRYFSWCFHTINNDSFWNALTWHAHIIQDIVTAQHHYHNSRDPMPNLGQTRIFYYVGQTWLTREKCDLVDPDDPDDPTRLQRWSQRTNLWFELITCVIVSCLCYPLMHSIWELAFKNSKVSTHSRTSTST